MEKISEFLYYCFVVVGVVSSMYVMAYVGSLAFFKAKLEYQKKFFRKFDPNHPGDK